MSTSTASKPLLADAKDLPMEKIAQRGGDVILDVCPDGTPSRTLLVSSVFLTTASEVFAALLGPHFREGQASRNEANPVTIRLPEDDPQAMLEMCSLLHLRDRGIFSLYKFATVVDKYGCAESLRTQAEHYLRFALRKEWNKHANEIVPHFVEIAAAAYLLDQEECFVEATWQLILNYGAPFLGGPAQACANGLELHEMLPMNVIHAMEVKRSDLRSSINTAISTIGMCRQCGVVRTDDKLLARIAGPHKFWPVMWNVGWISLEKEFARLEKYKRAHIGSEKKYLCPECNYQPPVLEKLQFIRTNIAPYRDGVRLCCAKNECADIANRDCREHGPHPNYVNPRPF